MVKCVLLRVLLLAKFFSSHGLAFLGLVPSKNHQGRDAKAEESARSLGQLFLGAGLGRALCSGVRCVEILLTHREFESGGGAGHDEVCHQRRGEDDDEDRHVSWIGQRHAVFFCCICLLF